MVCPSIVEGRAGVRAAGAKAPCAFRHAGIKAAQKRRLFCARFTPTRPVRNGAFAHRDAMARMCPVAWKGGGTLRRREMQDPFTFADLLGWLWPVLVPLWLWGVWRVRQDLRRVSRVGPDVARCGLPQEPLAPPPARRLARRRRPMNAGPRAA